MTSPTIRPTPGATDETAHAGKSTPPQKPERDPWFDNAKILLVTLVVVGHSWTLLPANEVNNRLYDWLYLWHMPAFVMITGYFSRSFTYSRRHLRKLVTTVLLPYLVFEGLLALFRHHVGGEEFENLWINPHWTMWYLVVLVVWRLVTPLLRALPHAVPVAIGISLLGGLVSVPFLDLNRAMGLLPFFVIGLLVQPHHIEAMRSRSTRLTGLGALAAGILVTRWVEHEAGSEWLYHHASYAERGVGALEGMATRLGLIGAALTMSVAALAWIPRRRTWFTRMGAASVVVYLFHGFFVKGAEYAGLPDWASAHPVLSLVLVTAGAAALALALAWRPVSKKLAKVVTPT